MQRKRKEIFHKNSEGFLCALCDFCDFVSSVFEEVLAENISRLLKQ